MPPEESRKKKDCNSQNYSTITDNMDVLMIAILVSSATTKEMPHTEWLKLQKLSQFWRLEVQDQGVGKPEFFCILWENLFHASPLPSRGWWPSLVFLSLYSQDIYFDIHMPWKVVKGTIIITFDKTSVNYLNTISKSLRVKQRALSNPNAKCLDTIIWHDQHAKVIVLSMQ